MLNTSATPQIPELRLHGYIDQPLLYPCRIAELLLNLSVYSIVEARHRREEGRLKNFQVTRQGEQVARVEATFHSIDEGTTEKALLERVRQWEIRQVGVDW